VTHVVQTSEGAQELAPRDRSSERELLLETGAVLRMSEADAAAAIAEAVGTDDETFLLNMGPQHPSTHGVLRLMLELRGETVLRTKPIIGYLHTGMEKTGEDLTYLQGPTNTTRMDYASPFFNELVFCLATEALLGVEIPPRATWIRMLMCELNRMASHLLFLATNGMDLGAVSMMLYGWRERDLVMQFFEKVTGLRMNHEYIRPGGVAVDLPDGWRDDVLNILDVIPERLDEYDQLMTGQPIWRDRTQGVGAITPEGPSPSAPPARCSGARAWPGTSAGTCRTWPTTSSSSTWWSAPTATSSTATPSASTRCGSRCGSCARSSTRCRRVTTGCRTRR
jgi:NADH-quinone oxidoreductase subunit D